MKQKENVIRLLKEGINLLSKYNSDECIDLWIKDFNKLYKRLEEATSGDEVLSILKENYRNFFGGMGAFHDLVICEENGFIVQDEEAANKEVRQYTEHLYQAWDGLTKELEKQGIEKQ